MPQIHICSRGVKLIKSNENQSKNGGGPTKTTTTSRASGAYVRRATYYVGPAAEPLDVMRQPKMGLPYYDT